QIESLRCAFTVERSLKPQPNAAEVRVWNLSPTNRQTLEQLDGVPIKLEAGYSNTLSTLYLGELHRARTHREDMDLITVISSNNNKDKLRKTRINVSLAK